MPATWTTQLTDTLIKAGLATETAEVLTRYFPDAPAADFLAGLDIITEANSKMTPPLEMPTCEPWAALAQALQGANPGADVYTIIAATMADWALDVQSSIADALSQRAAMLDAQGQPANAKGRRKATSAEYMAALDDLGYTFRLNDLNDRIEVNGLPLTDTVAARIRSQMRDRGFDLVHVMEDAYTAAALDCTYHPVRDYLDSLAYDGGPHIATLLSYFRDRDNVMPVFLTRWLIGAVARVYEPGLFNPVLVLNGPQNVGKSQFVRWLAGGIGHDYYYEGAVNPDDKDVYLRLMTKWLWEVQEMSATQRRADREALKAFLTQTQVSVRKPYGAYEIVKPPLASFIGTDNQAEFLPDKTGSRRYMVCKILDIDWRGYVAALHPDQVWAEAVARYRAGEPAQLTQEEYALSMLVNEEFEIEDPIEGMIKRYFLIEPDNDTWWTPTVDVLSTLEANGLRGVTRANAMALAENLAKLGLRKTKARNQNRQLVWGYKGIKPS